jgi:hypothetical protein
MVIDFRCIARSLRRRRRVLARRAELLERGARGILLGDLLAASGPVCEQRVADDRGHRERPVVRRAVLFGDLVQDRLAVTREPLLQGGLEVDRMVEGILDLLGERLTTAAEVRSNPAHK